MTAHIESDFFFFCLSFFLVARTSRCEKNCRHRWFEAINSANNALLRCLFSSGVIASPAKDDDAPGRPPTLAGMNAKFALEVNGSIAGCDPGGAETGIRLSTSDAEARNPAAAC